MNDRKDQPLITISHARKVLAVFLGFFYGGSLVNGVARGIDFVFRTETGLRAWPVLEASVGVAAVSLASFLAAYNPSVLAWSRWGSYCRSF